MSSNQDVLSPMLVDQIRENARGQQLGSMGGFLGLSLLVYDSFITLTDEIELVWAHRPYFCLANCLYFINRYFTLFSTVYRIIIELSDQVWDRVSYLADPPPCSKFVGRYALNWITVANWLTIESMLILCVYGLWERSKLVGAGLTVLVVSLVSLAIVMRDKKPNGVATLEPTWLFPCQAWEPATRFWLYTVGLAIQVTVFSMFVYKAQRAWRPEFGGSSTKLTRTLWSHCVMYYSITLALMGVGLASTLVTNLYLPIYTAQILVPIVAAVALRLSLSLRQLFFSTPYITNSTGLERTERWSLGKVQPKDNTIDTGLSLASPSQYLSHTSEYQIASI